VDELSPQFSHSNNFMFVAEKGCGFNTHAYYTWSTTDPAKSTDWGEWRPQINVAGRYEVWAYAPYCDTNRAETGGATYRIQHATGTSFVTASHNAHVGTWMKLGEFFFTQGNSGVIRLTDLTSTDSGLGVWFDALRFRYLSATPSNPSVKAEEPAAQQWYTTRHVNFRWSTQDVVSFNSATLKVATDAAMSNLVLNKALAGGTLSTTHDFGQDYAQLYWQVSLTLPSGAVISTAPVAFGLDTAAPTSTVWGIFQLPSLPGKYVVGWRGDDPASGVAGYTVDYRISGSPTWTNWLINTPAESGLFTPPSPGAVYCFRVRAVDRVGNAEAAHSGDDRCTLSAITLSRQLYFPIVRR
jgi:hypothetical protein